MRWILLLTFFFFQLSLSSDESAYSPDQLKEYLDFELKYQSALLESAKTIEHFFQNYELSSDEEKLDRELTHEIRKVVDTYAEHPAIKPEVKKRFIKRTNDLILHYTVHALKRMWSGRHVYMRRNSISIAVSLGLGNVVNVVSPIVLTAMGQAYLATAALAFPFSTLFVSGVVINKNLSAWQETRKHLNNKMSYLDYRRLQKKIKSELNIKNDLNFLAVLSSSEENEIYKLTIKNRGSFFSRILNRLGLKNGLSFNQLKRFLKENDIESDYTTWLIKQPFSEEQKTLLLAQHFLSIENHDIRNKFLIQHSHSIQRHQGIKENPTLKKWAEQLSTMKTPEDIKSVMSRIPPNTHPLVIIDLWERLALPVVVDTMPVNYGAFRTITDQFSYLKAQVLSSQQTTWDSDFALTFKRKIGQAVPQLLTKCKHPQRNVLNFLLKE